MQYIILPQAFRIVIPPLINNIVALLKDTSLVSSIALLDLTLAGNRISSETFLPVPVLTTVAFIYLALTTGITAVTSVMEKRFMGKPA
jgi:polar amino acid transport system permease protein